MKPLLIVASLLANAALVAGLALRPTLAPAGVQDFWVRHFHSVAVQPTRAPVVKKTPSTERTKLWLALHSDDARTFVARLRAAGFPPAMIRALVSAGIDARFQERYQALMDPDPDAPFWKMRSTFFYLGDKRLEEMNQLQRDRTKQLRDLFSDDFFASDDVTAAQRRQFGNLPRSKIDVLQRIEDDYTEMNAAIRSAANGIILPEDREKLALLAREKRADLTAMLSPEEFADYEMRSSPTTNSVRNRLAAFNPSEAEFKAIFQAQQTLNDKFSGSFTSVDYETRNEAQRLFQEDLRMKLGEARYADYTRETSNDFQQLNRLAQRENLPRETAIQAFNIRDTVAKESNRIIDDTSLNTDAKRAALQSLAQNTRNQLLATLGPAVGPEYLKIANGWLSNVERGSAVSFGRQTTMVVVTSGEGTVSYSGAPEYRRLPSTPPNR